MPNQSEHILNALIKIEKILEEAEEQRFSPAHHRLMEEANALLLATGMRVMHVLGWEDK